MHRPRPLPRTRLLAAACIAAGAIMAAPAAAQDRVGPCDLYANLLRVMIDPGTHSIPIWVRPFTDEDDTAPELLRLRDRCLVEVEAAPAVVDWTGTGPGLKPGGRLDEPIQQPADRPRLPGSGS